MRKEQKAAAKKAKFGPAFHFCVIASFDLHMRQEQASRCVSLYHCIPYISAVTLNMPREDRSRSPYRSSTGDSKKRQREESQSPRRRHHRSKHAREHRIVKDEPSLPLPFNSRSLSRHDLQAYKQLFSTYLDIQKNLEIEDLEEDEVKGRWKSFVGKW